MTRNAAAWCAGVAVLVLWLGDVMTVAADTDSAPTASRPVRAVKSAATQPSTEPSPATQPTTQPAATQPASRPVGVPTVEEMKAFRWVKLSKPPEFSPAQHGFESVAVRDGVVLMNKNGGQGWLDLTEAATSQPADGADGAVTSRPASLSAEEMVQLLADLGDADWERAERASMELAKYDRQAEAAINDALTGVVNEAFRTRAAGVLERIYAARVTIVGTWEEQLWANVKHKQQVRITADAAGTVTLAPSPVARYRHYVYTEASFDGTTLTFHVRTNPDYEFDVELTLTAEGELTGTRTRTGTDESWEFRMTRLRDF